MPNIRPLNNALAKIAAEELNEKPKEIEFYIIALREWAMCQNHFKSRTTDQFLIAFLRNSKYNLEKAKRTLESFYVRRLQFSEIFENREKVWPKLKEIIKLGSIAHLPEPTAEDGQRVVMFRPGSLDLKKYSIIDICKVGSMGLDILLHEDDQAIIAGFRVIVDLSDVTIDYLRYFDATLAKKMLIFSNKMVPTRLKGFHVLHAPSIFEKCYKIVKNVISAKTFQYIHVHGSNFEEFYEHIPQRILPKIYGGECDATSLMEFWEEKFNKHQDFLKEEDEFYQDLKKRIKTLSNKNKHTEQDNEFGLEGTFRKLNLD